MQASEEDINALLRIEAAKRAFDSGTDGTKGAFFENAQDLYQTIDSIHHGAASWTSFSIAYTGPPDPDTPWKHVKYPVYTRNSLTVLKNMAASPDLDGKWEYRPYEKYVGENNREFSNLMSGRFAYKQAVSEF